MQTNVSLNAELNHSVKITKWQEFIQVRSLLRVSQFEAGTIVAGWN